MIRKVALVVVVTVGAAVLVLALRESGEQQRRELLAVGRDIYAERCASCHGVRLEGQPNWQDPLPNGRMPAPPHDATGHTWHHSDAELFAITRDGMSAVVANYQSDMPAFGQLLSDPEIHAVLAFIKSTWPEKEREYQAERTKAARP